MGPGTSFAAPIVSGVVALVLQANSDLSWRDVHGILATTAKVIDPSHTSWSTNGAGLQHSNLYGYGLVDAGAAVKAATTWELYPKEQQLVAQSGDVEVNIPDYPGDGIESSVQIETSLVVESINVYLDLRHSSRGDLEVMLVSPSGTKSVLHPSRRPENTSEERWKLLTVKHWSEPANGTWSLRIVDHNEGSLEDCVDRVWKVQTAGSELSCGLLERLLACENGEEGSSFGDIFADLSLNSVELQSDTDISPADACCSCGGGASPDDIQNALHSWQLVVFGHAKSSVASQSAEQNEGEAQPPTTAPVASLSEAAKTQTESTSAPSVRPLPSQSPSISATKSPVKAPTTSPSERPTETSVSAPTEEPTLGQTKNTTSSPATNPTDSPQLMIKSTATPSASPTVTSAQNSTHSPSLTEGPTLAPTSGPTTAPTVAPTSVPSTSPTDTPTQSPTAVPSTEPTSQPSEAKAKSAATTQNNSFGIGLLVLILTY